MAEHDGRAERRAKKPRSTASAPSIYSAWLESSISSYEALAKELVGHRAEKGRIVEGVVKAALRTVLPGKFSIGTGFAITASGRSSPQLDVVIYDAVENAPIILEGGTGLFPIESIYACIEVKSIMDRRGVDSALKSIAIVRSLAREKAFLSYGVAPPPNATVPVPAGKGVTVEIVTPDDIAPRAYIFAVNSAFPKIEALMFYMGGRARFHGAHVHGSVVTANHWFLDQAAYQENPTFSGRVSAPLSRFSEAVLMGVRSMQLGPAEMGRYFDSPPRRRRRAPPS